jgi:AcrR family transcriptional regulator
LDVITPPATSDPAAAGGTPGTKQARGRERRSAILASAGRLFAQHGVASTSIATVAADVGITDAGLLYHFPTKDDLVLAVLYQRDARTASDDAEPIESAVAALDAAGDWGTTMEREESLTILHITVSAEHLVVDSPLHTYFRERYAWVTDRFVRIIEHGQATGEFRSGVDARAEAASLLAAMDGARLQWFYSDRRTSIAGIVRRHVDEMLTRLRS